MSGPPSTTSTPLPGARIPTLLPTHGVGTRTDLPVPTTLTFLAAGGTVLISFLVLALLWRRPRTHRDGLALPTAVDTLVGSTALRALLRAITLAVLVGVVILGFAGPTDTNRNLGPWLIYVWLWVGLVPASLLLRPRLGPAQPAAAGARAVGPVAAPRPRVGPLARCLPGSGGGPPRRSSLGYLWVELVLPTRADPPVLAGLVAGYAVVQLVLACAFGRSWFELGDVFEVYSRLIGSMSPIGRRDGRLVLRSPLDGLADLPTGPGLTAVLVVLIGGTAFDGLSRTSFWQSAGASGPLDGTIGLALSILLIAVIFLLGTASTVATTARDTRRHPPGAFAHSARPDRRGLRGRALLLTADLRRPTGRHPRQRPPRPGRRLVRHRDPRDRLHRRSAPAPSPSSRSWASCSATSSPPSPRTTGPPASIPTGPRSGPSTPCSPP